MAKLIAHEKNGTLPPACKQRQTKAFDDELQKKFDDARKNYEKTLLSILILEKKKEATSLSSDFINKQNSIRANIKLYVHELIKTIDASQLPNNAESLIDNAIWEKIQQYIRESELNRSISSSQKRANKQIAHNKIAEEKQIIEQNVAEAIINQKNPNTVKVMIEEVMEAKFQSFAEKNLKETIQKMLNSTSSNQPKGILKNSDSDKKNRNSRRSRSKHRNKSSSRSQSASSRDSRSSSTRSHTSKNRSKSHSRTRFKTHPNSKNGKYRSRKEGKGKGSRNQFSKSKN